jgi:MFS family permease
MIANHPPASEKDRGAAANGPNSQTGPQRPISRAAYDATFWLCFAANALLMVGVTIMFRYADFVTFLGGDERQLGLVVGVGMFGALFTRVVLGVGIDRIGPRVVWLLSLTIFVVAALLHLRVESPTSPLLFLARILLTTGIAGAVGASLTYVSLRVPENRIAEMVGMLGTSGFLGLAVGPVLGDLLFWDGVATQQRVDNMFLLAALAGGLAWISAAMAMRGELPSGRMRTRRLPPVWRLIRRYQPGAILLVAAAMGLGVGLPNVFLPAFAAELDITGIRTFFLVYATVAVAVRIGTRRLAQRAGIPRVTCLGIWTMAASMLLYLIVRDPWQLAIPAIAAGVAHALLFPAIVAGGSISFPHRYRGLATTLVLASFDIGNLVGQPLVGYTLYFADQWGMAKYPVMFLMVATTLAVVGGVYYLSNHGVRATASKRRGAGLQERARRVANSWRYSRRLGFRFSTGGTMDGSCVSSSKTSSKSRSSPGSTCSESANASSPHLTGAAADSGNTGSHSSARRTS